jgi:hypothetical protein
MARATAAKTNQRRSPFRASCFGGPGISTPNKKTGGQPVLTKAFLQRHHFQRLSSFKSL